MPRSRWSGAWIATALRKNICGLGSRCQLAEEGPGLELHVDRQVLRAKRQRAGIAAARERRRLEHGVVEELGEVSVETAQAERGLREVGHVTRNRIGAPEHGTQLPEQLVVGVGGHAAPPCRAGSTPTNERSFSRQRIRVGPMAPIGMPSAAPIVS